MEIFKIQKRRERIALPSGKICLILTELYSSVGADNLSRGEKGIPIVSFINSVPFCHRAFEIYACKARAIFEYTRSNARNTVWDNYTCKATASTECSSIDGRNAVGDGYARNTTATGKRTAANSRNAISDNDVSQTGTIVKRQWTYEGNAIRNINTCKATTIPERIIANARNTVGNIDARKATALVECQLANARNAVRDDTILASQYQSIGFLFDKTVIFTIILCIVASHSNAFKGFTSSIKCVFANARNAVGDSYARKVRTMVECPSTNASNAVRNSYACKATAIPERRTANARNTVGDYKIGYKFAVEV